MPTHNFTPGADVYIERYGYGSQPRKYEAAKVNKVLANGNVVLVGDNQQYRCSGDRGTATGGSYSRPSITLVTPEATERAEASARYYEVERVIRRFDRMDPAKLAHDRAIRIAAILDEPAP